MFRINVTVQGYHAPSHNDSLTTWPAFPTLTAACLCFSVHMSSCAAALTRQPQHRLEPAALKRAQRGGGAAHPQTLKLPLTAAHRLHLTPHLPHLRGGAAGLQTPGHHAQKQTHNLQAHRHAAQCPWKHLETPGNSNQLRQWGISTTSLFKTKREKFRLKKWIIPVNLQSTQIWRLEGSCSGLLCGCSSGLWRLSVNLMWSSEVCWSSGSMNPGRGRTASEHTELLTYEFHIQLCMWRAGFRSLTFCYIIFPSCSVSVNFFPSLNQSHMLYRGQLVIYFGSYW